MQKRDQTPPNNLGGYLNLLNNTPLLTLKEEQTLLNKISIHRDRLFIRCNSSFVFRKEVVSLLQRKLKINKDGSPIQSGLKEYPNTTENFSVRLAQVCEGLLTDKWPDFFVELELSGNFATSLINTIQLKHKFLMRSKKLEELRGFFGVPDLDHLFNLTKNVMMNPQVRLELELHLAQTPQKVRLKLLEVVEHRDDFKKLKHLQVKLEESEELTQLHEWIDCYVEDIKELKEEVIKKNLRLVVARAKYFVGRGFCFESIVQEGNLGLIKAIEKFSPRHNAKLSTYATWWIDQTIQRAIANKSKTIRIPTHIQTLQAALKDCILNLTDSLGVEPSNKRIAKYMEIKENIVVMLKKVAQHKIELETELADGTVIQHHHVIEADILNPFNVTAQNMLREKIHLVLAKLPPEAEKIIRLKFGIGMCKGLIPEQLMAGEIAAEIGVTAHTVRTRISKVLDNIKKELKDYGGELDE